MLRRITRQRDSMRVTSLSYCLRVIVNEKPLNLYLNLACLSVCLSVCLFVCLHPMNVKTADPIGPNFFVGHLGTPGKVYE